MATIISTLDISPADIDEHRREKVYRRLGRVVFVVSLIAAGCGGGSPTAPSQRSRYAGEWSGGSPQTFPGQPGTISFTVSNDGKVTAITLNTTLNGCAISRTLSGLSVDVAPINDPQLLPSFDYGNSALLQQTNAIAVQGTFLPSGTVTGVTQFFNYMNCGSGAFLWGANKR